MKKIFLISAIIFLFASQGYSSVTTIDGAITLDFYEDTQFGNNRWILDMTINDYDGPGGFEATNFHLTFANLAMNFDNPYNQNSIYYSFGLAGNIPDDYFPPEISTPPDGVSPVPHNFVLFSSVGTTFWNPVLVPVDTQFLFYATPDENNFPSSNYIPIIGDFYVRLSHSDNTEYLMLTGPIGFATVPEPAGMCLFALGAFFLKFLIKRK